MAAAAAFAPVVQAEDLGVTVRITSTPTGIPFSVDGQVFWGPFSAVWPKGSKHVLIAEMTVPSVTAKTQYAFKGWFSAAGSLPPTNQVIVTADAATPTFVAQFEVTHALTVTWFGCPDEKHCPTSGSVYAGGALHVTDFETYFTAGSIVQLTAVPSPGYVFGGWAPGPYQSIAGMFNSVTMNQPIVASPIFLVARPVHLETIPAGLDVLADRARVSTPTSLDWAWGSTHTVGPVSPQEDKTGRWWAFAGWSDGGDSTHSYKVANLSAPDTVTATYVPVAVTQVNSIPAGLPLKVDARDNWPSYNFPWGIGETHRLEAPAEVTDDQGRLWTFASWSNGGNRVQTFTVPDSAAGSGVRVVATYNSVGRAIVRSAFSGVTVKVDGEECGIPCDIRRPAGTKVQLSAPASINVSDGVRADFNGWPGSGSTAATWTYTLTGDPANLNLDYHLMNRLVTEANPPEGVNWRIQPNSPDGYYDAQAAVVVSVSAMPGFRFRVWEGDASGTSPTTAIYMNSPRMVHATLDRVPYISPAGIQNGAGATPQEGVAAGSIVSILGASLAPAATAGPESPMVQTLAGVTVRVGDRFLPLFFVSPGQVNVLLPDDMAPGKQFLTVSSAGLPDVQAAFSLVRNAPGLFQQSKVAVAVHEDGSPVSSESPARKGELLSLYGTGFGPVDHARPAGFPIPADPPFRLVDNAAVQVGDASIPPENAFAAPGKSGIDVVQFRLPDSVASGNLEIRLTVNGQDSNTVVLPVQ